MRTEGVRTEGVHTEGVRTEGVRTEGMCTVCVQRMCDNGSQKTNVHANAFGTPPNLFQETLGETPALHLFGLCCVAIFYRHIT